MLLLLEPLDELARTLGDEVLVLAHCGGPHAAVPVLAPPEVRLRVLDPDHGQLRVGEQPSDEVCKECYERCNAIGTEEAGRTSGRTGTLGETGRAEQGVEDGAVADR